MFNTTTTTRFSSISTSDYPHRRANITSRPPSSLSVSCAKNDKDVASEENASSKRKLSKQSSWEAKDAQGNDYLYRLGKEADNMNIAVGARAGVIDDLFAGNFLGRDCNFLVLFLLKI